MDKMNVKQAPEVRATLYSLTCAALSQNGMPTESIKGGALIDLGDGYFAKMSISICDASKFNVEDARADYQEQIANREIARKKKEEKDTKKD